jgi:putative transposase
LGRPAGLRASKERPDALDNTVAESFLASMQNELLYRREVWNGRNQLANAMFVWIKVFSDRQRRHSTPFYVSPVVYDGAARRIASLYLSRACR